MPHQVLEAHEHDQQFGDNESIDIGKSQRLHKVGNPRINKVSAIRPGLAKIIEKVRSCRYFESPETNLHIAANACCVDYTDTLLSKQDHSLSKSQRVNCGTTNHGCEDMVELVTGVAWVILPITRNHPPVAAESKIQWLPATLPNTEWMDHRQGRHGRFKAIPVLNHVDFEMEYGYTASCDNCAQWHVRSYEWRYASPNDEEDSMEGRCILRREVWTAEAVAILCGSNSHNPYVSHFSTYPWSFPEVANI